MYTLITKNQNNNRELYDGMKKNTLDANNKTLHLKKKYNKYFLTERDTHNRSKTTQMTSSQKSPFSWQVSYSMANRLITWSTDLWKYS